LLTDPEETTTIPDGTPAAPTGWRARRGPCGGGREVVDPFVYSTDPDWYSYPVSLAALIGLGFGLIRLLAIR
jgi:hypothetical protein